MPVIKQLCHGNDANYSCDPEPPRAIPQLKPLSRTSSNRWEETRLVEGKAKHSRHYQTYYSLRIHWLSLSARMKRISTIFYPISHPHSSCFSKARRTHPLRIQIPRR